VQGFLYDGAGRIVAELDGQGAVVSRFVYATRGHVPDYLLRAGATYRIFSDTVGSPRLIVDTVTCQVVQQLTYDEFGRVLLDSNPGFQPFGFAGGLYDRDTNLLRFGARDYDPEVGRWIAKDPMGFEGGDSNLYAYAGNNPIQFIDPTGLSFWDGVTDFAAGFGDTITFGATQWVRQKLGVDDVVNPCSGWYGAGQIGAVGVGAALAAGAAAAALAGEAVVGIGASAQTAAGALGPASFGVGSLGAASVRILQSGGNKILPSTARALNNLVDTALHRREWGRAVEALKKTHELPSDFHGIITSAGGYLDKGGKFIDNILEYL
jgi:RHS repeat-associated protein